jgi:N-acetylneuraminic acid mutarotase
MKKLLILIVLALVGAWGYFYMFRGVNLITQEDGNVGLPAFSIAEQIPERRTIDVGPGNWRAAASLPTPRIWPAAVTLNDRIYVIGGMNGFGQTTDTVEIYDPFKDSWSDGPPLPEGRHHVGAAVLEGKIYVVGGLVGVSQQAKNTLFVYDPQQGGWTSGPNLPNQIGSAGVIAVNGQLHVFGGRGTFGVMSTHFIFDPFTNEWTTAQEMTSVRDSVAVAEADGFVWVIGGRSGAAAELGLVEYWRLSNSNWADSSTMPMRRAGHAATTLSDRVYFFGGTSATLAFKDVVTYDPMTSKWLTVGQMPVERHGFALAQYDGMVFIIGGGQRPGWSVSDLNQVYIP